MIINNQFEDPYNKFPPNGPIPFLSQPLVKSKLSNKFWKITKNIFAITSKEGFIKSDKTKNFINNNPINNDDYNDKQNNNNYKEKDEKTIYIEKFKMLKEKNEIFDKIISQQEEENNLLVKKVEELENILKTKINLNNNI